MFTSWKIVQYLIKLNPELFLEIKNVTPSKNHQCDENNKEIIKEKENKNRT